MDQAASSFPRVNRLLFTVSPTPPKQDGGLFARQPTVTRFALRRKGYPNRATMEAFSGVMVDRGSQGL
jgi:hypothetical protein